ncbi:MAG: hypothetical protein CMB02_00865 [Euryarchaeota archaeon]|nr:hypothetical protein [Euryarchaeota archaeon]
MGACISWCRRHQGLTISALIMGKRDEGPKWVEMPSVSNEAFGKLEPGENYHDLGLKYPDAPVPRDNRDIIVHRAQLNDISGVSQLMDWVSEGDIAIVEMTEMMDRDMELKLSVGRIQDFIEADLRGQLVRLGNSRLLLLPPTFSSRLLE